MSRGSYLCFGLFIAAGSFFLGPNNHPLRLLSAMTIGQHLRPILFGTNLYLILTALLRALLIFWLVRVRFVNAYSARSYPARLTSETSRLSSEREIADN